MITFIKKNLLYIALGIVTIVSLIFLRDSNTGEVIKGLIRRLNVESEVDKLKEVAAKNNVDLATNEESLLKAAEAMKIAQINVKTASDEQIAEFYKNYFKK